MLLTAVALAAVLAVPVQAQSASPVSRKAAGDSGPAANKIAVIKSLRIIQEKEGSAVEILATRPLTPAIDLLHEPTRLVIDLANARLDTPQKINVQTDEISALRANQFQMSPPVARVVVDLLTPRTFTWSSAGNRLVVRLGRTVSGASQSPFQAPAVPSLAPGAATIQSVRAAGPLTVTHSGSVGTSFAAGTDTAVLDLSTGGEVHVCPGTTVSITPSQNRHNLMMGMNTGALEIHMRLDASTDTVMTPDFRIALVGPGEFHYAFSTDNHGDTCVRALPGNTASAIVTELLGDRTYQVRASDQVVFRGGQLDRIDQAVPLECGCPPPRQTTERAMTVQEAMPRQNAGQPSTPATGIPQGTESSPDGASQNELHVQVTAPLVFRANGPPPNIHAPVEAAPALPTGARPTPATLQNEGLPPSPPPAKSSNSESGSSRTRTFFHRIGSFFSSIFH